MRLMKKVEYIDAVKYESGMEDGFSCQSFVLNCVFKNSEGSYRQCDECTLDIPKKPYLEWEFGYSHFDVGDYIVTDGDDNRYR